MHSERSESATAKFTLFAYVCVLSRRPSFLPSPLTCSTCLESRPCAWTTCAVTSVRACSSEVTQTHTLRERPCTSQVLKNWCHNTSVHVFVTYTAPSGHAQCNSIIWEVFDHNITKSLISRLFSRAYINSCRWKERNKDSWNAISSQTALLSIPCCVYCAYSALKWIVAWLPLWYFTVICHLFLPCSSANTTRIFEGTRIVKTGMVRKAFHILSSREQCLYKHHSSLCGQEHPNGNYSQD